MGAQHASRAVRRRVTGRGYRVGHVSEDPSILCLVCTGLPRAGPGEQGDPGARDGTRGRPGPASLLSVSHLPPVYMLYTVI